MPDSTSIETTQSATADGRRRARRSLAAAGPKRPTSWTPRCAGEPGHRRAGMCMRRNSNALLLVVCLGQFMVILDVSIVNVALPSIKDALGFSSNGLQWVLNAYTLTFAGFLLLGGRAADLLGRRRMFVTGSCSSRGPRCCAPSPRHRRCWSPPAPFRESAARSSRPPRWRSSPPPSTRERRGIAPSGAGVRSVRSGRRPGCCSAACSPRPQLARDLPHQRAPRGGRRCAQPGRRSRGPGSDG